MSDIKRTQRALFLGLQADAKAYPGGIEAIARHMHRNGHTLAASLNPDSDTPPPSMAVITEIVLLTGGARYLTALCALSGLVPVDIGDSSDVSTRDAVPAWLRYTARTSEMLSTGADAAADLRFDAQERESLTAALLEQLRQTYAVYRLVRSC